MPGSLITVPLRVSLRTARAALRTTRDVADIGLVALELAGRALGGEISAGAPHPRSGAPAPPPEPSPQPTGENGSGPAPVQRPVVVPEPVAEIEITVPFDGYESLRAAELVTRIGSSDPTELAAIARYESTHRRRRTVLDAVARAQRRLQRS